MQRPFFSFAVFRVLRVTPLLPVQSIVRTDGHKKLRQQSRQRSDIVLFADCYAADITRRSQAE